MDKILKKYLKEFAFDKFAGSLSLYKKWNLI